MSIEYSIKNSNSSINEKEDKEKNISIIKPNKSQNDSNNISNLKLLNSSKQFYPYPICFQTEKDPLDDYKLRLIKARNKGSDTFLKNYLRFNFTKNDIINKTKTNTIKNLKEGLFENNKINLFITESLNKYQTSSPPKNNLDSKNNINNINKEKNPFIYKKIIQKSKSELFNPFSRKAINSYKTLYLREMEKRGNLYNKRKLAYLQRIALHNFSSMNLNDINDSHFVNGSIPYGKSDESYILETQKRKRLPGIKEYLRYRLKSIKDNERNTPEYYRERSKKFEINNLPEIYDIKNSGRFKFHVFHDQYGFVKELDKKQVRELKMTKEKIRDLKIMAKINKIKDPDLIDTYKRALYS